MTLQERQKWREPQRNFSVGDVVILQDESHCNKWRLTNIIVYKDKMDMLDSNNYYFTHTYQKPQLYDFWFLRYGAKTEFLPFLAILANT